MAEVLSHDVTDVVFVAMRRLKPRYRALLVLRCFRRMKFAHIAESLQCSEFVAKVQFYRAKRALQRQLSHYGFDRGMFITALVVFGKMTAPTEAAAQNVAVPAAMTKVGLAAGLAAAATSKTALLCLTAAGAVSLGAITVATSNQGPETPTVGGQIVAGGATAVAKGLEECWHYYPEGTSGPVMMRMLNWDAREKRIYCRWLQNERANYFFDKDTNRIYIRNHRIWHDDLSVWRLPTDGTDLQKSLSIAQPGAQPMQDVAGDGPGLLVILRRDKDSEESQVTRNLNMLEEQYFLFDWPSTARVIDQRDPMHRRGWTYFRISGELDGQQVSGTGRIPFVFATRRWHYPWLKMRIGEKLHLVDTGTEADLYDASGKVKARYQGGSFFTGLSRPWLGLHTIDTIRRDAAREGIPFHAEYVSGREMAQVTVQAEQTRLVYTIDMDKDVVVSIALSTRNDRRGTLHFEYLQDIGETATDFASPRQSPPKWRRDRLGILWLAQVMDAQR